MLRSFLFLAVALCLTSSCDALKAKAGAPKQSGAKKSTHSFQIEISPGVSQSNRREIESALTQAGLKVTGGGAQLDGTTSEILLEAANPKRDLSLMISILQKAKVGHESIVWQSKPTHIGHKVYTTSK